MSNVVKADEKITKYLNGAPMQDYLKSVIGSNKDKFVTNLVSAVNQNKNLQECTNMSLVSGALVASTLNLSLNSSFGYAYLVPYKNKGVMEAQFQIGYKGYIQLAMRTGEYQRLNAVPIYRSQFVSFNALTEDLKVNNVDNFDGDEVVGYVSYFRLNNGFEKTFFWSYEKMMAHSDKYSKAFNAIAYGKLQRNEIPESDMWRYSSFWYKDFNSMALKTMLRQLLSKYGILSEEMEKAYEFDNAVVENGTPRYVDNDTNEPRAQIEQTPQKQEDLFGEEVPKETITNLITEVSLHDV